MPTVRRSVAFALLATLSIACTSAPTSRPGGSSAQGSVGALPSLTQIAVPGVPFSSTACVSLEPTKGSARGVVFLDAGHGGIDTGAIGHTTAGIPVVEKTVTLAIVKLMTEQIRAAGYRVVVSRWSDTEVRIPGAGDTNGKLFTPLGVRRDVLARTSCANAARAKVLMSVHMNSFSDPREGGALTLWDPDRPFARSNKRLATLVHANVIAALRRADVVVQDRHLVADNANHGSALTAEGARYGHSILLGPRYGTFVPVASAMPGSIAEPLFLTRPAEANVAASARGQALLADAIARAVLQYLA
jgi:N-acetylmuramoyl-L-alanine amidase